MWSGFSSEIETSLAVVGLLVLWRRMWSGFSSEIETQDDKRRYGCVRWSHVERLLV